MPAVDGPFVEVSPGTWVRASVVLAVEAYTDGVGEDDRGGAATHLPTRGGAETFGGVVIAGGHDDPTWWRSPYHPAQLREALRLAEHAERLRTLEGVARLVLLAARRHGDGR
jgi:hypothetical protein